MELIAAFILTIFPLLLLLVKVLEYLSKETDWHVADYCRGCCEELSFHDYCFNEVCSICGLAVEHHTHFKVIRRFVRTPFMSGYYEFRAPKEKSDYVLMQAKGLIMSNYHPHTKGM